MSVKFPNTCQCVKTDMFVLDVHWSWEDKTITLSDIVVLNVFFECNCFSAWLHVFKLRKDFPTLDRLLLGSPVEIELLKPKLKETN